ncbi:nitroreductase family deazaflavin-dependent oxidoreductase [Mycobacterium sp. PDNC021]|uniref:nitroreductase family deazaflavin-dependent oxidoreductase n=1 Tax=Mycobacterium sp. PDNC021 TaxID=3391399 RepID=UPI003AAD0D47
MDLVGLPAIRVTVAGRRTGMSRTSTLYCVDDGNRVLVIGSNWGHEDHPAWSANLIAVSEVDVRRRLYQGRATVRLLTGTERDQAWATILRRWPSYQIAQDRVPQRPFRIFELKPIST